jgi:hypothetical protein
MQCDSEMSEPTELFVRSKLPASDMIDRNNIFPTFVIPFYNF